MLTRPPVIRVRLAPNNDLPSTEMVYRSEIVGDPTAWSRGSSPQLAIGNLVMQFAHRLGARTEIETEPRTR